MTRNEQKEFVQTLISSVEKSLLEKADQWPEEWDGHELRRLIRDAFKNAVFMKTSVSRIRAYNNEVIVRNLI